MLGKDEEKLISYSESLRRIMRTSRLGTNTFSILKEEIDAGRIDSAKEIIEYLSHEGKRIHNLLCDWTYTDLDFVAKNMGEEKIPDLLREIYKVIYNNSVLNLSAEDLLLLVSETMRALRCGRNELGDFKLVEEKDRYVMAFDPCGSGGRMMRGSKLDNSLPRTGPPYNLGCTSKAYPWSWGKKGVPYYCTHMCMWSEIIPIELRGYPVKITDFPDKSNEPCVCYIYKDPKLIPEIYYTRIGKTKPINLQV